MSLEITGIRRLVIEVKRREGQLHLRSLSELERCLKVSGKQRQVSLKGREAGNALCDVHSV